MMKRAITINNIPAIMWGDDSDRGIISIHGNQSNKADMPIEILANNASIKSYHVLSFDRLNMDKTTHVHRYHNKKTNDQL